MKRSHKFVDLTGKRFGSIVVNKEHGRSDHGKTTWECTCDCGNIITIIGGNLVSGNTKMCTLCAGNEFKDIIGMTFGKWRVMKKSQKKNSVGKFPYWTCQCECGNVADITGYRLRYGKAQKCIICRKMEMKQNSTGGMARYEMYAHRLTVDEHAERDATDERLLSVVCTYCGKRYVPTSRSVVARSTCISGERSGEGRLYCSNACKRACPIYNVEKHIRANSQSTSREVLPDLRKEVLRRDKWTCQKCGETDKQLHVNHERPASLSPLTAHDPDVCITLCKDCHKEAHSQIGCRYVDLHRKECK